MSSLEFLRQFRIGPLALFDTFATFLGVLLLAPWLSRAFLKLGFVVPLRSWFLFAFPLSVIAHVLVHVSTPLSDEVIRTEGGILAKIVVGGLFFLGMFFISRKKS